jgi:hypothetical protein
LRGRASTPSPLVPALRLPGEDFLADAVASLYLSPDFHVELERSPDEGQLREEKMREMTGRCLCGQVRYSATAEPAIVVVCHCKNCQKSTGTAFSVLVGVPKSAISIEGPVKRYMVDRDDLPDEKLPMQRRCGLGSIVKRLTGEAKPTLANIRNDLAHGYPFDGLPWPGLLNVVHDLIEYAYRDIIVEHAALHR